MKHLCDREYELDIHCVVCQDLVEDSEDDRGFDEISETAPPIELPAAELARLEVLSKISLAFLTFLLNSFFYIFKFYQCSGDFRAGVFLPLLPPEKGEACHCHRE